MKRIFKATSIILAISLFSCDKVTLNNKVIKSTEKDSNFEDSEYVSGTDDVPLMPGLAQIKEDTTSFDTISGNIVISTYGSKASLNEIRKFYLETLPQLGWILEFSNNQKLSYNRKGDSLEILLEKNKKSSIVKFYISSSL